MIFITKSFKACFIFICFLFIPIVLSALPPDIGDKAPDFNVRSGDGKIMTLDLLKGKVIVMFYNTRGTISKDSELREVLNKFYDAQPGELKFNVYKLAIIDCSSAYFPINLIWEKKLSDASKEKKMDIYGDWDGRVAEDYDFNHDDTNMVIIDKTGRIRYIARKEVTSNSEINKIVALLNQII